MYSQKQESLGYLCGKTNKESKPQLTQRESEILVEKIT
jgi:hypothetical protein